MTLTIESDSDGKKVCFDRKIEELFYHNFDWNIEHTKVGKLMIGVICCRMLCTAPTDGKKYND